MYFYLILQLQFSSLNVEQLQQIENARKQISSYYEHD